MPSSLAAFIWIKSPPPTCFEQLLVNLLLKKHQASLVVFDRLIWVLVVVSRVYWKRCETGTERNAAVGGLAASAVSLLLSESTLTSKAILYSLGRTRTVSG
jgi:hypothetical protein